MAHSDYDDRRAHRRDRSPEPRSRSRDRGRDQSRSRSRNRADNRPVYTKSRRHSRSRSRSRSASPRRRSRSPRRRQRSPSPKRSISPSRRRRRARSRSRSKERQKRRRTRSRSASSFSTSDSNSRRHKKRKDKHRKRSWSRDKKDRKKEKKEKKAKKKGAASSHWGKYGIISETDLYNKEPEFRTWLVEERVINPETISKDLTKKEFAKFVEDYNTATLPHEKFYDMEKYERHAHLLRSGEALPIPDEAYDASADLAAISSAHKRGSSSKDSYITREQLEDLRKVQNERYQVGKMKLLGMNVKQSFGVRMDGTMFDG